LTARDPLDVFEEPWDVPCEAVRAGLYRRLALGDVFDHLVVYLLGVGGDPEAEYRAPTTACGKPATAIRPRLLGEICPDCSAGIIGAFRAAYAAAEGRS
jgi:hypothetical protein